MEAALLNTKEPSSLGDLQKLLVNGEASFCFSRAGNLQTFSAKSQAVTILGFTGSDPAPQGSPSGAWTHVDGEV